MHIGILGRNIRPPWNEAVKNMAFELARQLAKSGHKIHLVTTEGPPIEHEPNLQVHSLPARSFGQAALRTLLQLEKANELEVLHVQNLVIHRSLAPLLGRFRKKSKVPIVAYCCQLPSLRISDWAHVFRKDPWEAVSTKLGMLAPALTTRWMVRMVDKVVASSKFIRNEIARSRPERDVEVIPPFVRPEPLERRINRSIRADGEHTLLYLGSHKVLRGEDDFLLMLGMLKRRLGDVSATAVTTYPIPQRISKLVKRSNLTGNLRFLPRGIHLDVPSLIEDAGLYVFTGLSPIGSIDPPLTIIESLILGTPVVSYRSGGIDEVLPDGTLARYGDYSQLASLAFRALSNGGARHPRPDLLSRFGSESAKRKFEEIYEGLA